MKKLLMAALLSLLVIGGLVFTVFAAPDTLNWGTELNAGECDAVGPPIVNVVQKVMNDVDSGLGGNWAFDNETRHIQVWATSISGVFCTIVQYEGKFDAVAGQTSPGTGGILDGDEDGTFQGGYRAIITGTLKNSPGWKTRGSVGTFDYGCDISGDCPGYVNWLDEYFDSWGFSYEWWGWIYHAGKNGTWVNSSDGNSGDIF